ncbi:BA75_00082T0 [Komagataella pastoris]|uniref:Altered inheritance of mitochondria protein 6 n=1 Tax=Komagataella pastoris TaxID=4922 RepID=A0A1B2J6Q2_PICPA|nr:BA75_00082T0 [Komagataella pastoris]
MFGVLTERQAQQEERLLDEEEKIPPTSIYNLELLRECKSSRRRWKFFCVLVFILTFTSVAQLYLSLSEFKNQLLITTLNRVKSAELTKDIDIIPIHSHNDEWRRLPLYDALRVGAQSVEADVWYFDSDPDTIFVGHNKVFLSSKWNLDDMYLNPLFSLIGQNNIAKRFEDENVSTRRNGIFYNNLHQTLYLYLDIKSNSEKTMAALEDKLSPFINNEYLSYYNSETDEFVEGPVTVIITGNYPYDYIVSKSTRYFFIDAPLFKFKNDEELAKYNHSCIALASSASLYQLTESRRALAGVAGLSEAQVDTISSYIDIAHNNDIKVRIWETPSWPVRTRNEVWKQLITLGVDTLNVDDLYAATTFF